MYLYLLLLCGLVIAALACRPARARAALYREEDLIHLDKDKVGGGVGQLLGRYAFTRDMPPAEHAVKEIAWLTLEPGCCIGLHTHSANEDVYIIISGRGAFIDADGVEHAVKSGDITIARKGDSHALANTGEEPLRFISMIAE
jgi:mannose-6-phosphate isomerase-like protein (cupin superfamily)